MKEKAKENDFKSQVDKMGNAIEKSRMETAVNRYVSYTPTVRQGRPPRPPHLICFF